VNLVVHKAAINLHFLLMRLGYRQCAEILSKITFDRMTGSNNALGRMILSRKTLNKTILR
jgi:hypothetical protein